MRWERADAMTVLGIDASVLGAWFSSRTAQSALATAPRPASATNTEGRPSLATDVEPPWSIDAERPSEDRRLARALSGRPFLDREREAFPGASPDEANLFRMWVALDRLRAVAEGAADSGLADFRRTSYNRAFQDGLAEILDFARQTAFTELQLTGGVQQKKAESTAGVQRSNFTYQTPALLDGAFDDPLAGLSGTERFSAIVDKIGGTQIVVDFDLADVAGPLNLDNLADYFNTRLEAEGAITRFKRVKIGTEDEDGVVQGGAFGLELQGASSETIRFQAETAEAAVYIAGVSGSGDASAGQFAKITGIDGGAPEVAFARRLEAEGETTVDEEGAETTEAAKLTLAASASDSQGNVYVVGTAEGDAGGQILKGERDAVLTKYDSTGQVVWTRTLGAGQSAEGFAVAVDADDNVIVAGAVQGDLAADAIGGGEDAFVTKFSALGAELWTYQRAPTADDAALGLSTGSNGEVYVVGRTQGRISGDQTYGGGTDGFLLTLDANGTRVFERQFGGAGDERAVSVAEAADGNLIVASLEDGRAYVTKYDASDAGAAPIWRVDLGDLQSGGLAGLAVEGSDVYLAGYTRNPGLSGPIAQGYTGGDDGFVAKISDAGGSAGADFVTYVGVAEEDRINGLTVEGGRVFVTGSTTGDLTGAGAAGSVDTFAAEISGAGATLWSARYGGFGGVSRGFDIEVDPAGSSVLDVLGLPTGAAITADDRTVVSQTSVRDGDFFYVSVDGGAKRKVEVEAGDTMRALAFKVESALGFRVEARSKRGAAGDVLEIKPAEGQRVELFAGDGDFDALKGLGLSPGELFDDGGFLAEDDEDAEAAADEIKSYVLGLAADLSVASRTDAERAAQIVNDAMLEITKAYREINTDPALTALLNQQSRTGGPVPAYLTSQLSNYQAALSRLQGGGGGGGIAGLF